MSVRWLPMGCGRQIRVFWGFEASEGLIVQQNLLLLFNVLFTDSIVVLLLVFNTSTVFLS